MGSVIGPSRKKKPPTPLSTIAPETAMDFMIESEYLTDNATKMPPRAPRHATRKVMTDQPVPATFPVLMLS